jgi:hypothetical protein
MTLVTVGYDVLWDEKSRIGLWFALTGRWFMSKEEKVDDLGCYWEVLHSVC